MAQKGSVSAEPSLAKPGRAETRHGRVCAECVQSESSTRRPARSIEVPPRTSFVTLTPIIACARVFQIWPDRAEESCATCAECAQIKGKPPRNAKLCGAYPVSPACPRCACDVRLRHVRAYPFAAPSAGPYVERVHAVSADPSRGAHLGPPWSVRGPSARRPWPQRQGALSAFGGDSDSDDDAGEQYVGRAGVNYQMGKEAAKNKGAAKVSAGPCQRRFANAFEHSASERALLGNGV